jgi:hypothetical protein
MVVDSPGVGVIIGVGVGAAAVASSADVVVVVDVGGIVEDGVVAVVAPVAPGDPCVVMVVDVVGTLGELGVMTVWLVTDDEPVVDEDCDDEESVVPLFALVSSANDADAREVHASMVALTIKSFWDRIGTFSLKVVRCLCTRRSRKQWLCPFLAGHP